MRFDTGPFDALHGERVSVEVPCPDGTMRRVSVTKKWLEREEQLGNISKVTGLVLVHVAEPGRGCYVATWKIGQDVDADTVKRRLDPETQALYAIVVYTDGIRETHLCDPGTWAEAQRLLQS
ncbi:MAG: hypothetical protein ABIH03_14925 [Pseudomonadota bacterium]